MFEAHGLRMTLKQWAKLVNVPHRTIEGRLRLGWSFADAIRFGVWEKTNRMARR